jgi:hypothetical protein
MAAPFNLPAGSKGLLLFGTVHDHRPQARSWTFKDWEIALVILGMFSVVCIAVAIFNKLTADRLKREIDALDREG